MGNAYYQDAVYGSTSWLWIAIIAGIGIMYRYGKKEGFKVFVGLIGLWLILDYLIPAFGKFGYWIRTGIYLLMFIGFVLTAFVK